MKKSGLAAVVALIWAFSGLVSLSAQGFQWQRGSHFYDVTFADSLNGWVVGQFGSIIRTTDGGNTWSAQTSPSGQTLRNVHFVNAQIGCIVGDAGTILRTTNGGATWAAQTSGTTQDLHDVFLLDAQNGWATGNNSTALKTTNGGMTWVPTSVTPNNLQLRAIAFLNPDTGLVVGQISNSIIMYGARTTSGGADWGAYWNITGDTYALNSMSMVNTNIGWAVGILGRVCRIENSAGSLACFYSGTAHDLYDLYALGAQDFWVVGASGTIRHTTNGGQTWTQPSSGTSFTLRGIHFTNAQNGWAVGENGIILRTTNGGATWANQLPTPNGVLQDIHFADCQHGWAVGTNGLILGTSNAGKTWSPQNSGITTGLFGVHFADDRRGWAVGAGGTVRHTTDGGATWAAQSTGTTQALRSVFFADEQKGWAVGTNGTIIQTSNGGVSWVPQTSGTAASCLKVHFVDTQNGWIATSSGILHTTDGGQNWAMQSGISARTVHFADTQKGWAAGGYGNIWHTSDGGATWAVQPANTTLDLLDIHFSDTQNGWAVGDSGIVVRTLDGGINWTKMNAGKYDWVLYAVHFPDGLGGWFAGEFQTIMRHGNTSANMSLDLEVKGYAPFCPGGNSGRATAKVLSGGNGPYAYAWSSGSTSRTAMNLSAGIHRVTVSGAGGTRGCGTVLLNDPLPMSLTFAATPQCSGSQNGTATVTAAGGNGSKTYLWSNGGTTKKITGLSVGNYTATVSDSKGCTVSGTAYVGLSALAISDVVVTPVGSKFSALVVPNGGSAPYRYRKCPTCSWGTANPINNLPAGTYTFGVRDASGCTAEFVKMVGFGPAAAEDRLSETSATAVRVFPNPATDGTVWVDLAGLAGSTFGLRLLSSSGAAIGAFELKAAQEIIALDIHDLESGLYFLEITSDTGERAVEKLRIEAR